MSKKIYSFGLELVKAEERKRLEETGVEWKKTKTIRQMIFDLEIVLRQSFIEPFILSFSLLLRGRREKNL
jgi:hypothetical protein